MIEVPEYLLERSRQRRAELTGQAADSPEFPGSPGAPAGVPASAAPGPAPPPAQPAPPAARAPVVQAPPPPPEPDPPYVQAAKARKKMPVWAATVMVFLPIWAVFYVGMLEPPSSDELVLSANGADVYSTCASCHGGDGSGTATGRQLSDGEVLLTFPAGESFDGLAHHLSWVYLGTQGTRGLGLSGYGDPDRPGGQREPGSFASGMSGFSNLTLDDLVSVVYYERVAHGGLDLDLAAHEEQLLLALAADDPSFTTGSPEEMAELLAESAAAHGVGAEAEGAAAGASDSDSGE